MTPDPTPMQTLDVHDYMKLPGNIRQRVRDWLSANGIDPMDVVQVRWDDERIEVDHLEREATGLVGEFVYTFQTEPHVVPPTWEANQ